MSFSMKKAAAPRAFLPYFHSKVIQITSTTTTITPPAGKRAALTLLCQAVVEDPSTTVEVSIGSTVIFPAGFVCANVANGESRNQFISKTPYGKPMIYGDTDEVITITGTTTAPFQTAYAYAYGD